jgi:hypothetical protein
VPIAGIGEAGFDDKAGFRYHGFVCGKFRTYGAVKQWLITGSNFFAAYGFGIDLLSKRPDICKHNDFSDKKYLSIGQCSVNLGQSVAQWRAM